MSKSSYSMSKPMDRRYDIDTIEQQPKVNGQHTITPFTYLCVVIALVGFGLISMYSASYDEALRMNLSGSYFFTRQLVFAIIGFAAFILIQYIPMRIIRLFVWPLLVVSGLLMLMTLFTPFGVTRLGSKRWLELGPLPSFQPSELLKVSMVLFMSAWYAERQTEKHGVVDILVPVALVGTGAVLIVAQRDFSSAIVFLGIAFAMFIIVGIKLRWMLLFILTAAFPAAVFLLIEPYRIQRLIGFLFPDFDPSGINWQVNNSLKAMANGGLWGTGIGKGQYKLGLLPEVQNDFIFANIIEETGIIGLLITFTLFFLFSYLGFKTYRNLLEHYKFEAYTMFGFTCAIIWQALINIAVVTGLLPPTGLPLPFFSQGGTSLLVVIAESGLMYKIICNTRSAIHREPADG